MNTLLVSQALSDPIRLCILQQLAKEDGDCCPAERGEERGLCNCELMSRLNLPQSRVSYHLRSLVEANLVLERPQGKWHYYSLHRETLSQYLAALREQFQLEE